MSAYRRQALTCILLCCCPLLLVGGLNYVLDPLQIYRARPEERLFWTDQRHQNAGKLRSYLPKGYDAVLLGSSVADPFLPGQVAARLGWGAVLKLSVVGGSAGEQALMLEQALERAPVQRVLWVLNLLEYAGRGWDDQSRMPRHLYTDGLWDDAPYLFSLDILRFGLEQLRDRPKRLRETDLERLNYWMDGRLRSFVEHGSPENLARLRLELLQGARDFSTPATARYPALQATLLRLIRANPGTEFVLLVSPKPWQWMGGREDAVMRDYFGVLRELTRELACCPNATLFGFEDQPRVSGNLANYSDVAHFTSGVADWLLREVAAGRGRLVLENVEGYVATVERAVEAWEPCADYAEALPLPWEEERRAWAEALAEQPWQPLAGPVCAP